MQVWVKNYSASNVIDMQVLPSYKDLFNATGYLGEAPQLSTVYGKYDNGHLVFPKFYTNFVNGMAGFSYFGSCQRYLNYSYVNGLTIWDYNSSTNNLFSGLQANLSYNPQKYALVSYDYSNLSTTEGNPAIGNSNNNPQFYTRVTQTSSGYQWFLAVYNGNFASVYSYATTVGPYLFTIWENSTTAFMTTNNTDLIHYNGTGFTPSTSTYIDIEDLYNAMYLHVDYIFLRTVLPSMPTFTIGTFTNMTDHAVASYLSNSITIPMPNWFNLTLKAYTNYSFTFHYNNTPLYFTYDGLINNTIYTGFLDSNLTLDIHFIALGYSGKTELIVGR